MYVRWLSCSDKAVRVQDEEDMAKAMEMKMEAHRASAVVQASAVPLGYRTLLVTYTCLYLDRAGAVVQASAAPLGYRALLVTYTCLYLDRASAVVQASAVPICLRTVHHGMPWYGARGG